MNWLIKILGGHTKEEYKGQDAITAMYRADCRRSHVNGQVQQLQWFIDKLSPIYKERVRHNKKSRDLRGLLKESRDFQLRLERDDLKERGNGK